MATITEIGRSDGKAYGVLFVVCSHAEVIGLATVGSDPSGNGWEDEARSAHGAAANLLWRLGYDYQSESTFSAYNGGPRRRLVDAIFYEAEVLEETEEEPAELGDWRLARSVPESVRRQVEAVQDQAIEAMEAEMRLACDDDAEGDEETAQQFHESGEFD